jgi:hypothetical protein
MAATDIRKTVLEIINEVREKLALDTVSTLYADKEAKLMTQLLNDVIDEVSDYGDWKEMLRTGILVTASSSVFDYTIETSALVKNIHEIAFDTDISPMWLTTLDDILRLNRSGGFSRPRQWAVIGVDSYANPQIRVFPTPGSNENNLTFKVTYYKKPELYSYSVTADSSKTPEFPSRVLVAGLLAAKCLEESGGEPTQQYAMYKNNFDKMLLEAYNRFNADSGSNSYFKPTFGRSRFK